MLVNRHVDVAIVGASIAGAVSARVLLSHGHSVALIDGATFPRRKPCGEGLSWAAYQELLGCGFALSGVAARPFHGFVFPLGSGAVAPGVLSEANVGVAVERRVFDAALIESLRHEAALHLRLGSRVRSVEPAAAGWAVRLDDELLSCRAVICADGARSLTAAHLGVPVFRPAVARFARSLHLEGEWRHVPSVVSLFAVGPHEIYCTPLSDCRVNVTVLSPKRRQIEEPAFRELLAEAAARIGFHGEPAEPPLVCGPTGSQRRPAVFRGVFLAGDACEQFDPVGGMGMTHAISSGRLAAESISAMLSGRLTAQEGEARYGVERERAARPWRGFTRLVTMAFRNGLLRSARFLPVRTLSERCVLPAVHQPPPRGFGGRIGEAICLLSGWNRGGTFEHRNVKRVHERY